MAIETPISNKEFDALTDGAMKRWTRQLGPKRLFRMFEHQTMNGKDRFESLHFEHLAVEPRWVQRRVSNNQSIDRSRKHHVHRDAVLTYLKHTPYFIFSHLHESDTIPKLDGRRFDDCVVKPLMKEHGLVKTTHKIGREVVYCLPGFDPFTIPGVRPGPFDLLSDPKPAALFLVGKSPMRRAKYCDFMGFGKCMEDNPDLFPQKFSSEFMVAFAERHIAPILEDFYEGAFDDSVAISHVTLGRRPRQLNNLKANALEVFKRD